MERWRGEMEEAGRWGCEMEEVESHRQRPPLVREGPGLPLGDKDFPGNIIIVIKEGYDHSHDRWSYCC